MRPTDMRGKVIVITGGTSGIGQAAAEKLAGMGARMVVVARDPTRGEATLERLKAVNPGPAHRVYYADLSLIVETRRVAREIAAAETRIDVLANNAGAIHPQRVVTREGLEQTFAVNHMSYFIMTEELRSRLAPDARIVNTASEAHRTGRFDPGNLQSEAGYGSFRTYSMTKLLNILFTRELARRLRDTEITVNCLHPGVVASRLFDNATGVLGIVYRLATLFMISSQKGAETLIYLASSAEVEGISGEYFSKCRIRTPTPGARDDAAARNLWSESARLYASV